MKIHNSLNLLLTEQCWVLEQRVTSTLSQFWLTTADSTNNLGVPTQDDASTVLIRGGEVLRTEPFVADGEEIQLNDKRYGVSVNYNSDTSNLHLPVAPPVS